MIWLWVGLAVLALAALGTLFCLLPRRGERKLERLRQFRYAHRGLHNAQRGVPENSLLAFRYAISGGFGIEMDVRLSRDRVPVVIHDGHLQRLCGVEGFVERSTVEQLRQTPLLGSRERIPTLEEALATVKGQVPVLLELKTYKNNVRDLCLKTAQLLESYRGEAAVISFDPRVLRWMRRNEPFLIRGQVLEEAGKGGKTRRASLLANLFTRPDLLLCSFRERQGFFLRFCVDGLKGQEVSWTVQKQEELQAAEAAGAMVIFEGFLPRKTGKAREEKVPS